MLWTCGSIASSTCVCDLPPECECPNLDQYRQSADVDHQTDDEVLNLCYSVPKKDWTTLGCPPRLTPDVVAKRVPRLPTGWPSEALAQDLIHNRTNIPVPPIWRVLNLNPDASVIAWTIFPGSHWRKCGPPWGSGRKSVQLSPCEATSTSSGPSHIPNLKFLDLFSRAKSLEYAMRHASSGPSGPTKGPFATSAELIWLFNNTMDQAALARLCVHKGPLPDDGTLIYSHVDLAMRNLIVGEDGQLWLIDFATAGFLS